MGLCSRRPRRTAPWSSTTVVSISQRRSDPMGGAFDGRVAIVTGSSRGIGAEIARKFAAEGAAVAVAARTVDPATSRLPGTITATAEAIRAAGGQALAVPVDLSSAPEREKLVAVTEQE